MFLLKKYIGVVERLLQLFIRSEELKTRCKDCRTLIEYGNTYCDKCYKRFKEYRKKYTTEQNKKADKLLDRKIWKEVRRKVLFRDKGCCVLCLKRNIVEYRGLQVHHIVKRVDDATLAYDMNNLVTLCRTCHEEVEKLSVSDQKKLLGIEDKQEETHFLL